MDQTIFVSAYGLILDEIERRIVRPTPTGTPITAAQMRALRRMLANLSLADLQAVGAQVDILVPHDSIDPFLQLRRAVEAISTRHFRRNLDAAKGRFRSTTTVDIRGCRIGQNTGFLEAIREFFGLAGNLPRVTAPDWYQEFPTLGEFVASSEMAIDEMLASGISLRNGPTIPASEVMQDFDSWADDILIDDAHLNFWKSLFQGRAIDFCLLAWRRAIPPIGLDGGRLAGISALSFNDTLARVREIFNVAAASIPASLASFIAALPQVNQQLSSALPASPTAAQLRAAHLQLLRISQQLAQTIVPATAPASLSSADIRQWKSQLIAFIETTKLAPIKAFLTACAAKANHRNAKYRYLLFLRLPALIYRATALSRNLIVALNAHRDEAARRLLRSYWAEPLPVRNLVGTVLISQNNGRLACILLDDHPPNTTTTAACPTPAYDSHIIRRPV